MAVRSAERGSVQKRRINAAFLTILACYLLLMARLLYLQGLRGNVIRSQATHNREEFILQPAQRGRIFSRDNSLLAVSLYSGDVGFDPSVTLTEGKDAKTRRKMEERLTQSITTAASLLQIPEPELAAFVRKARNEYNPRKPKRFARIKRGISLETAQAIRDARFRLLGFAVRDGSTRVYASGDNAAHVVGFVNAGGVGQAGLERSCGPWLKGENGRAIAELDDHHREIPETLRNFVPEKDGLDVHTTLDANAQHVATQEAQKIIAKYHPKGVSIVVLDPENGDVLALVSAPNFDPNPDQRAELNKLPKTELPEHFRDRCASSLYEPGSTLKALTIAAALDKGIVTMNSGFYCSGELKVSKKTIHCAHGEVHGDENVRDILRHSCNVGAAQIGMRMTARKLYAADKQFGLLDKLDVPLPGATSGHWSLDRNEKQFTEAKAARVAFGHSIVTTPLHVALAYAALANGGTLMRPRLITSLTEAGGRVVQKWDPQPVRRVVSPQTSVLMTDMLRSVVSNGTAKLIAVAGFQMAGKTGTAKKYQPGKYIGSFVGYLPASPNVKPRAVILVAVDEPQGDKYYGGEVAAPAFQAIATQLMQSWHVPEDDPDGVQYKTAQNNLKHPEKLHIRHH
jgi:stage V sporulation protein D (sporulation-specific penicillin-binding protein)